MSNITISKDDLSIYNTSLPSVPENEIIRESIVKQIKKTFTKDIRSILIYGMPATGKTVLLSQFVRTFPDRCFSFFIGEDYWSSSSYRFLFELCNQMRREPHINVSGKYAHLESSILQEFELKQLFTRLYTNLINQVKKGKGPYYFVIDGLDKVPNEEDSIYKYLPSSPCDGIFFLLSSKNEEKNICALKYPVPSFSLPEAEKYFHEYLDTREVKMLYNACDGMIGYLEEIYQQIKAGNNKEVIINHLPTGFNNLLEKEWERLDVVDKNSIDLLSVLTFAPESYNLKSLSNILKLDEKFIASILAQFLL